VEKVIDFYFDFMSPYAYLANCKLPGLAKSYGYRIEYHPIDIPSAKIATGNYGPSNRELPSKIKVLEADLRRWAKRYDVPFRLLPHADVRAWNIGTLYANKKGVAEAYVNGAYGRLWGLGADPGDTLQLRQIAESLQWDPDEFISYVGSTKAQTAFRKQCVLAHARGIFGAPIMMVNEEVWWGNDRLDFLEDYLKANP
jgi:2-hydroxychromene-2-carboxylate isomerase